MFYNINATSNIDEMIKNAKTVAEEFNNNLISTEHLLYGILCLENEEVTKKLNNLAINKEKFLNILKNIEQKDDNLTENLDLSEQAKQIFVISKQISNQLNQTIVDIKHILFSILLNEDCKAVQILKEKFNVNLNELRKEILDVVKQNELKIFEEIEDIDISLPENLLEMGTNLNEKLRNKPIEAIIGRDKEIDRIIEILCRKTKNSPVLIGEAGVGKTAIVEGLTQRIISKNVPDNMQNKIVYSLDIAGLMSGTKYRGALEEKLKNIINTILENENIILFIDEIHTLSQAGTSKGEISPADILKPCLARGEIQTIGATTTEEYRKFIEKDKALERRFQPIMVDAPNEETTMLILKSLKAGFESYHGVKITEEAIKSAVSLSIRYITDRNLPDKAIDLIDEASSKVKVNSSNNEIKEITTDDIAKVVSSWTGIPITKLTETEKEKLSNLEEILHKRIIGQDEAVTAVSNAIRRARVGLKENSRPIGSFMFLGPTGVGKTELSKALAEVMFDDSQAMIRLDMSEYMEGHSVSKLIGSPPGYVGFEEGGQLTEKVRKKPYSVVLFDEIEKAHPDILNLLLQILDDGRLTDAQGRLVDFQNTIIIMTSNAGVSEIVRNNMFFSVSDNEDSYEKQKQYLINNLKKKFEPEFLNRIDVITVFKSLSMEQLAYIAKNMINNLSERLNKKGLNIKLTEDAVKYLINKGLNVEYGARPLRRVIEQEIEDQIAEVLVTGKISAGDIITVILKNKKLSINFNSEIKNDEE